MAAEAEAAGYATGDREDDGVIIEYRQPWARPQWAVRRDKNLGAGCGHLGRRPWKQAELPPRWRAMAQLELQGLTRRQIAVELGLSINGIRKIGHDPRYKELVRQMLEEQNCEFDAMKGLAFAALRNGLNASDQEIALRASGQWFKAARLGRDRQGPAGPSAEEVAAKILHRVNVQVNVDNNEPSSSGECRQ